MHSLQSWAVHNLENPGVPQKRVAHEDLRPVITRKSEKSKVCTPAGKLKPTRMSTGESDSKAITTPLQQSFPEKSSF